jgi:hypothetical protein
MSINPAFVLTDRHGQRVAIVHRPLDWSQPVREAWLTWLRRHGLDPMEVCVGPGEIIADDHARSITYLSFVLDEKGGYRLDPKDRNRALRERRTVQLEAPALPFPHFPDLAEISDDRNAP